VGLLVLVVVLLLLMLLMMSCTADCYYSETAKAEEQAFKCSQRSTRTITKIGGCWERAGKAKAELRRVAFQHASLFS
jgi:hypothetical protein